MTRGLRLALAGLLALVGAIALIVPAAGQQDGARLAYSIELPGTIDPATERWVDQALDEAAEREAAVAIIRMDTPGGLVDSTREIVKDIIDAPMPVIVYVSPNGARAASAGLFITEAADVAAMAPQTNIGAATPVSLTPGETNEVLDRKIENDTVAFVRALAEDHGRNADLAEEMVRDAVSVTASVALRRNLIDVVSPSQEGLLADLNGFEVQGPKAQTLDTEGLVIEDRDMPLQFDLLQIIVNPNVAFLLLLLGVIGIGLEVFNPGLIVPAVVGGISLLLGLYGTALLPFTVVGILLLLLGFGLIIAEAHLPTSGILGGGGVLSLAAGGLVLFDTGTDAVELNVVVAITVAVVLGGLMMVMVERAVRAHRRPVHTGWEEMVGAEGVVRVALRPAGQVFVAGALWRARAADDETIDTGYRVRVESVEGLTLVVRPIDEAGPEAAAEDQASETSGTVDEKATEGAPQ